MVSPPTSTCALPPSSHLFEKQSTQQALEKHKRKPEALRGWCIYWLVMGLYTVGVQISDRFIFWVPMYCEAKVGFVVYLWHPRTQGAIYIYETFILPFLAKHEPDIDRHLDETRTSVGDVAVRHSQAAANFVREKFAQALASLRHLLVNNSGRGMEAVYRLAAENPGMSRGSSANKAFDRLGMYVSVDQVGTALAWARAARAACRGREPARAAYLSPGGLRNPERKGDMALGLGMCS